MRKKGKPIEKLYTPGSYRVTNKQNILDFFESIDFLISDLELQAIDNGFEMNEHGFMFVNKKWVKTPIYDYIWKSNSELIKPYFVPYYVNKTRLFPDHPEVGVRTKVMKLHQDTMYNEKIYSQENPNEYRNLYNRKKSVENILKQSKEY